jgi:hypothetical protein
MKIQLNKKHNFSQGAERNCFSVLKGKMCERKP